MEKGYNVQVLLSLNNVDIVNEKNGNIDLNYSDKSIKAHLDNLVILQSKLLTCKNPYILALSSNIWRDIEIFKVWNRRVKLFSKNYNNIVLNEVLYHAEESIRIINNLPYKDIILRSMLKKEICIGKPYENNLWMENNNLKIVDYSKFEFNLLEHDCYRYLNKLKKKNKKVNFNEVVNYFVKSHSLNKNSATYILALLSYPYSSMKLLQEFYIKNIKCDEKDFNSLEINEDKMLI